MRLNNYWWLLLWPILFGAVSALFFSKQEELVQGKREVRWRQLSAVILVMPLIIWAAWRSNKYGDTGMYRATFKGMPTGLSNMWDYVFSRQKGIGFVTFEYLFKTLISTSDVAFFFAVALTQIFLLARTYRKYSTDYWLSIFLFIASTDYLSWVHNGIRQFLAVTMIFACIPLIARKKYVPMCLVVLLATLVHSTALIWLPFVFIVNGRAWNARTILYIFGIIISIIFLDRVSGFIVETMRDTAYEGDISIFLNDDGTHFLRVLFYAVPTALAWLFRPYIDEENDPLINICVNLSAVSTGVYVLSYFTSGILVGAVPIYFNLSNYILIPWLIKKVFDPKSRVIVTVVLVGVYSFFFYYQCGPVWGLL